MAQQTDACRTRVNILSGVGGAPAFGSSENEVPAEPRCKAKGMKYLFPGTKTCGPTGF